VDASSQQCIIAILQMEKLILEILFGVFGEKVVSIKLHLIDQEYHE